MNNNNNLKEQHGLEILNLDNLEIFLRQCLALPEQFQKEYIPDDKNGLTCLILKVGDTIPQFNEFKDKYKAEGKTYLKSLQLAFARTLGFDDDDHFTNWVRANPQWSQDQRCNQSSDIFYNIANQEPEPELESDNSTYDDLINELCDLYDSYNFNVYHRTNPPEH
jgi:hypothetical protein